jgi:hypothetical protein
MRASLRRIESGLFGDDKLDQLGLVGRVKNHAQRIKRIERLTFYMTGAAAAVVVVYHTLVDLVQRAPGH